MSQSKLNKRLFTDITKLKLCNKSDSPVRFVLEKSPFSGDDDEEQSAAARPKDDILVGRIFPKSDPFKEGSYRIEMKLTTNFPYDPPEVHFLTPIYHPNVDKDGQFCHEILKTTATCKASMSLIDIVKAVVERIDNPDVNYSFSVELGKEYFENPAEFKRKALEFARKHALPRD